MMLEDEINGLVTFDRQGREMGSGRFEENERKANQGR